jgi:KDO2-lipid IV(A) lauroyltransferase
MSRVIYGWLTALMAGMPSWLGYALADALTELHFRCFPARRHAALANLAVMMPRASRKERLAVVRAMMRSYNRMMFEFFRLPHLTRDELLRSIEVVGREHLEQAVARGRGGARLFLPLIQWCTEYARPNVGALVRIREVAT